MADTTLKKDRGFSYIAFFDLDRTIIKAVSGTELAKGAWKKGLMKWADMAQAIYYSAVYKLGIKNPLKVVNKMTEWVKGIPEESLVELCTDVYNKVLLPSLHGDVIPEIRMHKEKGAKIVILSSSLAAVCNPIASFLGIDDVICSRLETTDGFMTGRPIGKLCFGDEKLTRLKAYCETNNSTPLESWYYADAYSDFAALSLVGMPVCVNPEKKLLKIARKKEWKVYIWS